MDKNYAIRKDLISKEEYGDLNLLGYKVTKEEIINFVEEKELINKILNLSESDTLNISVNLPIKETGFACFAKFQNGINGIFLYPEEKLSEKRPRKLLDRFKNIEEKEYVILIDKNSLDPSKLYHVDSYDGTLAYNSYYKGKAKIRKLKK